MTPRKWTAIAALMLMLGVMFGAFGAHALKDVLNDYSRGIYEKAVLYHFVNALGLLALAVAGDQGVVKAGTLHRSGILLVFGITIFSGSLYALAITGERWLGAITPIGGLSFMLAWAIVAWDGFRKS